MATEKDWVADPLPPLPSKFRLFCSNKWWEHQDEIFAWTGSNPKYDNRYYFNKHKWMLRDMFKEQEGK
jgi:hypothetical protein